ncbi:AI-2E family transporter [Arthrobacter mangrovi]|uniref:AI-2E family transporter n=1 Tax=Arthrobacter mangrovi TaxID=2966350 RepID=A0ABQ5MWB5_9MICC|nr:AI-2E family transporter [Arthrobacter mangrovi]GLB68254.1 AI-2E family transporter [Arthrobacter mangrovi]
MEPTTPDAAGEPLAKEPTPAKAPMPRFVLICLGLAGLAVFLYFVRDLSSIIAPVFLGLNLMIVAYPLQLLLARRIHRYLAAVITLVVVLALILVFFGATTWAATELLRELPLYNREFTELWAEVIGLLGSVGISQSMLLDQLRQIDASNVMSFVSPLLGNLTSVMSVLVTVVMTVFFLAMDSTQIRRRLASIKADNPRFTEAIVTFSRGVRRYWVVTTVFGLIVALLDVAALAIIGVPLVWVWGVLAFLTNYIPNIGFVIGLVPPALLALLEGGPGPALAVVAAYSLLNFSVQSIIQPKFTGEAVGVTATMSFLSLLFWYWVLGWLGALLALPATLLLKALLVDADPRASWINILISSRPPRPDSRKKPAQVQKAAPEPAQEPEPEAKPRAEAP